MAVSKCVKYVKIGWFCVEKVRIEALKGKIFNFNEITKITECTRAPVVYEDKAKADLLNQYFCSITSINDSNREPPNVAPRTNDILSD